jgi:hypothetical protein
MNGEGNHRKWHFRAMPLSTFRDESKQSGAMIVRCQRPAPRRPVRVKISDLKVKVMAWTSPVFEEVVLCCEINSYVSAKL